MSEEKSICQPCNVKDWTLCILGILIVLGFFGMDALIMCLHGQKMIDLSDSNTTILVNTMQNYKNGITLLACGYFFGASKANSDKDKTISDMVANAGTGNGTAVTTTTNPDGSTTIKTEPVKGAPLGPVEVVNAENTALKTEPATPLQQDKKSGE